MDSRILYVDDSGKPSPRDSSRAIVLGGFSVASSDAPTLDRRLAGVKARFYPNRGAPTRWEVKATRTTTPNPWKRAKNRNFVMEVVRILAELECTVYTVGINKSRMRNPMTLRTTMPLQLQGLVEHFAVECHTRSEMGLVISDWSSHALDGHASQCVASFVASRRLPVHPSVYYASSITTQAIQVADLVAGIRRRVLEGDAKLRPVDRALADIRTVPSGSAPPTHKGHTYTNQVVLF